nr:low molecular weight protein-tyrosine-phosphatase [Variovorax boronicumulans]
MYERILVVCTGNICRSPLAEALLRLQLQADGRGQSAQVQSAGTRALVGKPVDETVLYVARQQPRLVQELERHRAQQINRTLLWWADLILVMEQGHVRHLARVDPTAPAKARFLGHWIGATIADPYLKHESVYEETHDLVERAVQSWRQRLIG